MSYEQSPLPSRTWDLNWYHVDFHDKLLEDRTLKAMNKARRAHGRALLADRTSADGALSCAKCNSTSHHGTAFDAEVMACNHKQAYVLWPTEERDGKVRFVPGANEKANLLLLCGYCSLHKNLADAALIQGLAPQQLAAARAACTTIVE